MPMKKLVELNGEFGGWLEIDPVKLERVAIDFRNWLQSVQPHSDKFFLLEKDLPFVNDVLNGKLKLPFREVPHSWEIREGLLPHAYIQKAAPFYNVAGGSLDFPPKVVIKDGRYYAWTEWEDPPESKRGV